MGTWCYHLNGMHARHYIRPLQINSQFPILDSGMFACGWAVHFHYRIAGNFRKVFIFGYFEEALLFENKFPRPVVFRK